ncbi:MAG: acyl-CoA thioester hydrolase/BAAT C-terminal domain-containing protein [Flavobacteriaceae bacterium]|jgi:hypothetical protein|nr:acyl-CoA thioester hydrolase/BAAT C-terminal domain-containing protein [Flavobacteriaceae bacterium]
MNKIILIIVFIANIFCFGQNKTPKDYGYKHISHKYKNDVIDILIKSKAGEENIEKPIFLFCQGSLPQPLIKYDGDDIYGVFPFNPEIFTDKFHLVIISKPYIPIIADIKNLHNKSLYLEGDGNFPKEYSKRNLLDYYVNRNISVLKYLQKESWVSSSTLVVAGHSEGSTVASKMALKTKKITHLIYASGNPMGRIMTMISQNRVNESFEDNISLGEEEIKYWEEVVKNKDDMDASQGDTNKASFEFSNPPILYLKKLKIPVLVTYGTKDWSAPFNDFMRVDFIRKNKLNFTFQPYVGTEHNFFPLNKNNEPNYDIFNWDKVAQGWLKWIYKK